MTAHDGSDLPPFTYHRAVGLADALTHLRRAGARAYAGGTDLVVALRHRAAWLGDVRHLVDIKQVSDAHGIARAGKRLHIGALTTARELAASAVVRRHARVLAMAAELTSAPWIRARGTVGGNVMTPHPAGDVATALLALGAIAEFTDGKRRRLRVPVADLLSGRVVPSDGALLVTLQVPTASRSWYERVARRAGFCRAHVAVAVVDDTRAQIAVAGLSARPVLRDAVPAGSPSIELVDALAERALRRASAMNGRR